MMFNILKTAKDFGIHWTLRKLLLNYSVDKFYNKPNKLLKELAEAQAVLRFIEKARKADVIYDLACGHGFVAASNALRYPNKLVIGLDLKQREDWFRYYPIQNLLMVEANMYEFNFDTFKPDFIYAVHPCRSLAVHCIDIAAKYDAKIVLMPCCEDLKYTRRLIDNHDTVYKFLATEISKDRARYINWCASLAMYMESLGYTVKVHRPKFLYNYTPKDIILYGR